MSEKLEVIITGDGKGAVKAIDGVSKSTKGLEGAFKLLSPSASNTTSNVQTLAKGFADLGPKLGVSAEATAAISTQMAALAPAIGAVVVAVGVAAAAFVGLKTAIDLAVAAAPLENIQLGFDITAARAEAMGDDVLEAMQKASGGMVSMEKLMLKFNDASMLVSPDFALILADAMEPLQKVAATTGASMDYLVDSFVTGVGRLSKPILDNLRVTFDAEAANREFARTIGKSTEALTKQEQQMAAANYVLQQLRINTEGIPSAAMSASGVMARLGATFEDLKKSIGLAGLPIFTELARILGGPLSDAMREASKGFRTIGNIFRNTFNKPEMREALDGLAASMSNLFSVGTQALMKSIVALVTHFANKWATTGPQTVRTITQITQALTALAITVNRTLDALEQLGVFKSTVTDLQSASLVASAAANSTRPHHSGGIPVYASGTSFHPGGLAKVHKDEIIALPRGSQVYPNGETGGMKIFGDIHINTNAKSLSALMLDIERAATAAT